MPEPIVSEADVGSTSLAASVIACPTASCSLLTATTATARLADATSPSTTCQGSRGRAGSARNAPA